jgi:hypothetical protein
MDDLIRQFEERAANHEFLLAFDPTGYGSEIHRKFIRRLVRAVAYLNGRSRRAK